MNAHEYIGKFDSKWIEKSSYVSWRLQCQRSVRVCNPNVIQIIDHVANFFGCSITFIVTRWSKSSILTQMTKLSWLNIISWWLTLSTVHRWLMKWLMIWRVVVAVMKVNWCKRCLVHDCHWVWSMVTILWMNCPCEMIDQCVSVYRKQTSFIRKSWGLPQSRELYRKVVNFTVKS